MKELLPWLNLLLPLVLAYVVRMESRLTRLETLREAERDHQGAYQHRRSTDPK